MNMVFLYIALALGAALVAYNFRAELGDIAYFCFTHWKHTAFVAICIMVGLFMGAYNSRLSLAIDLGTIIPSFEMPGHENTLVALHECKEFVQNELDRGKNSRTAGDNSSKWDHCARLFGMNYWRESMTVNGEHGGRALCRAYRAGDYRSSEVETWCNTVFAPGHKL